MAEELRQELGEGWVPRGYGFERQFGSCKELIKFEMTLSSIPRLGNFISAGDCTEWEGLEYTSAC